MPHDPRFGFAATAVEPEPPRALYRECCRSHWPGILKFNRLDLFTILQMKMWTTLGCLL